MMDDGPLRNSGQDWCNENGAEVSVRATWVETL